MLVDPELMQRIEDAIAAERSAFADGMAAFWPESGASWLPVAGGRAIFTGAGFFLNRAMAMGLRRPVSCDDVERVETFYAERGVPSEIEIASMVDRSLLWWLSQRGYQLVRFRNIYAQALHPLDAPGAEPVARSSVAEIRTVDASTASTCVRPHSCGPTGAGRAIARGARVMEGAIAWNLQGRYVRIEVVLCGQDTLPGTVTDTEASTSQTQQ